MTSVLDKDFKTDPESIKMLKFLKQNSKSISLVNMGTVKLVTITLCVS